MRWSLFLVLVAPLLLAACGDTWEGAKQDTQDNVEATKDAF